MPHFGSALLIGFSAATFACAATPEASSSQGAFDPERMLEREADPIAMRDLEAPDGRFRASVPARLVGEVGFEEGNYRLDLDIGAEVPIVCFLYPGGVDLATGLGQLSALIMDGQETLGEIEARQISGIEAGAIDGAPYLGVRWLFRALQNEEQVLGEASTLIASKRGAGVACLQNELGFEQSLMRAFHQLVSSLEMEVGAAPPYYAEIAVFKMEGQEIGVQQIELTLDEDLDTRIETSVAMVIPRSATDLMTSDTYDLQYSTPSGGLINQASQSVEAGELSMSLTLGPGADGAWAVDGIFEHKEISGTIPAQPIESSLGQMMAARDLIAKGLEGSEVRSESWIAGADPMHLVEWKMRFLEQIGENRYRLDGNVGPIGVTGISDRDGSLVSGTIDMGPLTFEIERVHRFGDF